MKVTEQNGVIGQSVLVLQSQTWIDKIKKHHITVMLSFGDPEGIRTPGLLIRSQTLYPAELLSHVQGTHLY